MFAWLNFGSRKSGGPANNPLIQQVEALPTLDPSDFPALPVIEEGNRLFISQSSWGNREKEMAAALIITACVREGLWMPISAQTFKDLLVHPMLRFNFQSVVNAMWALVLEGLLKILSTSCPHPGSLLLLLLQPTSFE
jgi:hypothetical protein